MGAVCPLGLDAPTFWQRLIAGQSGTGPLTKVDTTGLRNETGGEVQGFDWSRYGEEGDCDEATGFAFAAASEALADAHLGANGLEHAGLALGTNFGGAASWEGAADMAREGTGDAELFRQWTPEDAARYLTAQLGLGGPHVSLSNACSSGASALGLACDWLRVGRCDIALAGGYDGLGLSTLAGLSILRTISPDLCRPFDKTRNGTVFGEGAGILVLETESSARRRDAPIYGELLGWAGNNNAYHLTAPDKGGNGLRLVMEAALRDAKVAPDEVDYINAHGTGTPLNDKAESEAIMAALGEDAQRVPVSSIKAALSHTMGAAGALEAIATVYALRDGILPPTLNYETPDPDCPLDYIPNRAREARLTTALSNSSGIGGNNACVVLRAFR